MFRYVKLQSYIRQVKLQRNLAQKSNRRIESLFSSPWVLSYISGVRGSSRALRSTYATLIYLERYIRRDYISEVGLEITSHSCQDVRISTLKNESCLHEGLYEKTFKFRGPDSDALSHAVSSDALAGESAIRLRCDASQGNIRGWGVVRR